MGAPDWLRAAISQCGARAVAEGWTYKAWLAAGVVDTRYQAIEATRLLRTDPLDRLSPPTLEGVEAKLAAWQSPRQRRSGKRIAIEEPPPPEDAEQPIEELIQARIRAGERKIARGRKHRRELTLPAEPVGILVLGDPHVDNDGCDWGTLHHHIELAAEAEGVLTACVGDMQDNWIGRLARLYSHSSIDAADGWRLSRWLLSAVQWVAIVGGNHDAWAHGPGVDPLQWLTRECGVQCYAPDELRITLRWKGRPELEPVIWLLRHDFKGRSWYHPTHGPNKEAMLDGRVHLLTAGHIHQWGALQTEHRHGRVAHAVRVRGYKRNDDHARALGFPEQTHGEAVLVVIDPEREGPGRIQLHWDIEHGLDYLAWLRAG